MRREAQLDAMNPPRTVDLTRGPSRTVFVGRSLPGVLPALDPVGVDPSGALAKVSPQGAAPTAQQAMTRRQAKRQS